MTWYYSPDGHVIDLKKKKNHRKSLGVPGPPFCSNLNAL
jgi:hypothetical protein